MCECACEGGRGQARDIAILYRRTCVARLGDNATHKVLLERGRFGAFYGVEQQLAQLYVSYTYYESYVSRQIAIPWLVASTLPKICTDEQFNLCAHHLITVISE